MVLFFFKTYIKIYNLSMPELPEVESIRRYIEKNILNRRILDIKLINKKSLRNSSEIELNNVVGQSFTNINRIAKHLILHTQDYYFIMHLRMEGKFIFFDTLQDAMNKTKSLHHILIIQTENKVLLFVDTRKFATIDFFKKDVSYSANPVLMKIGKEPFDLTGKELYVWLTSKRTNIKTALLDQSFISGLGNIYVDEVLFKSKIDPRRITNSITIEESNNIIKFSISILRKSIEMKGSSIRTYSPNDSETGGYQKYLNVYGRQGEECLICGNIIKKIKVAGRGTHICENCQK